VAHGHESPGRRANRSHSLTGYCARYSSQPGCPQLQEISVVSLASSQ
jgi:hypothetical protein